MTPKEHAAFAAGIRHAADLALIAALAVEIRPDALHVRQQAAIAALQGLAEMLKEQAGPATVKGVHTADIPAAAPALADRAQALAAGYTGDACPSCGSFALKRSGTCLACDNCGSTTGCS